MNKMEIRIANECDIDGWMNLVCKVKDSFPGLETKAALDGHRETVLDFIYKESAICARIEDKIIGVLLSKAWLYSGEDDCGVREQSAGVRNGSGGMANILTSSRILLSVLLIINIMPGFIVQMKSV